MGFHVPEKYRVRTGERGTDASYGNCGMFLLPAIGKLRPLPLRCIASDGTDWEMSGLQLPAWEHVSVSTHMRCPTWEEMSFLKSVFWDDEDTVIQFHPPKSEYVNQHPYCLHLWRIIGFDFMRPPYITVGDRVSH